MCSFIYPESPSKIAVKINDDQNTVHDGTKELCPVLPPITISAFVLFGSRNLNRSVGAVLPNSNKSLPGYQTCTSVRGQSDPYFRQSNGCNVCHVKRGDDCFKCTRCACIDGLNIAGVIRSRLFWGP